ncbi:hypothetical protein Poli38472_007437 [Pythium oligandrum]|uniref:Cyclic nucleotide-binding domain-containing protein n=1 Tax=Pythium oligandrum TaxID=41045 RepID=A0A8K1CQN8_PYTOL|nr:hypothetical protein Poli38472_007437 [Pythium oligandrum]|eukprot:TMW67765.1 hypothetical protein Poli38472_007437 [Pythium oligandrum]
MSAPAPTTPSPMDEQPPSSTTKSSREERQAALRAQLETLVADLDVDTGDVIIFDRKCTSMNLYGGAICVCAKFFGGTQWDHNGVVIRDPKTKELLFLEAALTGVKMRPLLERLVRSNSHEVAVRKLQVHRTPEFHQRAMEFATNILNAPYEDRVQRLLNAGLKAPQRLERERLFHTLIQHKKELQRLENDIAHRPFMSEFERKAVLKARDDKHEEYHALVAQLSQTERSMFENELVGPPLEPRKMFCSQLVASLYQHLGLLLPYPSANSYLPKHFSSTDPDQYLKLHQDARLLPETSLRKALDENVARHRQLKQDAETRTPRHGHELQTIMQCLRRHALFHSLSESELNRVASAFRRRVLTPGEVVFYQGEPGDFFYILEEGECDVFVDYDYLQKATEQENEGATKTSRRDVPLRRRKTLALPELQHSTSVLGQHQRVLVATNGPGSAFGESALIYDTPRRATIQATETSPSVVLWQLDKTTFKQIMLEHPATQCSMEEYRFLLETLSEHPLFSELDDRAKALAVRKCFPLNFRQGTTILKQGDSGDYFYVVESGRCEIARKKPNVREAVVDRVIGRGASFGEAALLYNSRRGASVRAVEDTKVWCMDRAAFLTITRSGSTALHKLFQQMSSTQKDSETYITQRDLRRLLLSGGLADDEPLSTDAKERAERLATTLLFHDDSGLVNFSQFAHFHIALGPSNMEQLLPEAAFRVLQAEKRKVLQQKEGIQWPMQVQELSKLMAQYANSDVANIPHIEKARQALWLRLFDVPAEYVGSHRVTYDDLARAITIFTEEDEKTTRDPAMAAAREEWRHFLKALRSDLSALRQLWRAAEFRDVGKHRLSLAEVNRGQRDLTFDANLRSGWISAIRHNPIAGDWAALPSMADLELEDDDALGAKTERLYAQATSFAAAITAGALSRTVCAPLERLKILQQLATPSSRGAMPVSSPYASIPRGLLNMVRLSGARSLFSGNFAHCLWVIPSLPTKFLLCDVYRAQLSAFPYFQRPREREVTSALHSNVLLRIPQWDLQNLLAGGLAGITANCLLYPLDVVRGRLSVQQYASATKQPYEGIRDAFSKISRQEGLRAFYRGFAPATVGVFSYIGCNYAIYEFLRPIFILYDTEATRHQLGHPSIPGQILCATTASLASQTLSYPFDLLRRRMQMQGAWHPEFTFPTYKSTWHCLQTTLSEADPSSRLPRFTHLYRGLLVNCVKALPSAVISFVSYEKIRELRTKSEDEF